MDTDTLKFARLNMQRKALHQGDQRQKVQKLRANGKADGMDLHSI